MARNLYSGFPIQNALTSTVVLINEVSEVLQRHYLLSAILLASLSIFAQLVTEIKYFSTNIFQIFFDFCTTADFEIKYFSTKKLLAFWVIPDFLSFADEMAISTQNQC